MPLSQKNFGVDLDTVMKESHASIKDRLVKTAGQKLILKKILFLFVNQEFTQ